MAESKKIQGSDLIDEGFLKKAIEEAKQLEKAFNGAKNAVIAMNKETSKQLQESAKGGNSAKELKEQNKLMADAAKQRKLATDAEKAELTIKKEKEKLEKEQLKREKELQKNSAFFIKSEAERRAVEKLANDELKARAIIESKLIGTEAKMLAQNTLLRIERARLNEEDENYQDNLKRINGLLDTNNEKISENSDKLKQNSMNVGNYTDSVREAIDSSEQLAAGMGALGNQSKAIIGGFKGIRTQLKGIKDSFKEGQSSGSKFGATLKGAATIGFTALAAGFGAALSSSREFNTKIKVIFAQGASAIGEFAVAIGNLFENKIVPKFELMYLNIKKLFTFGDTSDISAEIDALNKKADSYNNLFDGIFDRIKEGSADVERLIYLQNELVDLTVLYSKKIIELNGLAEIQNEIAGDSTRSFMELTKANEKALAITRERAALELEIARKTQDAVTIEVRDAFRRLGLSEQITDQEIKNLDFIKKTGLARKLDIDLQQKIADATNNVQEKKIGLHIAEIKIQRELRQIKQDLLEKDLDILIDGFDNQKTINEKKIADEKRVFEERRAILDETKRLAEISYSNELDTLQQFTQKRIDIEDLVNTADAKQLNDKIRALGLSEIIEGRLLEVVRERRTVVSDLAQAEKDLNLQEVEKNKRIKESQDNVSALRLELEKEQLVRLANIEAIKQSNRNLFNSDLLIELEAEKTRIQQESIDNEREIAERNAKQTIVETDELYQKLYEIKQDYDAKTAKNDQEALDRKKELQRQEYVSAVNYANKTTQALLENLDTELDKRNQIREANAQRELADTQGNITKQQDLASRGLDNQLAYEESQQAKRQLAIEDANKKAQKEKEAIQLVEAYFNALNLRLTEVGANPRTAPLKALSDTLLSKTLAAGLVQFAADGNEDVQGPGTTTSDSIPFMLSKHEGVVKASANMENKGVVKALNDGTFKQLYAPKIPIAQNGSTSQNITNSLVLQSSHKVEAILTDILNKPTQHIQFDKFGDIVETVSKGAVKKVITHKQKKSRI